MSRNTSKKIFAIVVKILVVCIILYKIPLFNFLYGLNNDIEDYKIKSIHANTDFNDFLLKDIKYLTLSKPNYINILIEKELLLREVVYLEDNCYKNTKSGAKLYNSKVTGSIYVIKTAIYNREFLIKNRSNFSYEKTNEYLNDLYIGKITTKDKKKQLYNTLYDELNDTEISKSILKNTKVFTSPYKIIKKDKMDIVVLGFTLPEGVIDEKRVHICDPTESITDYEETRNIETKYMLTKSDNAFKIQTISTLYHEVGHLFLNEKVYNESKNVEDILSNDFEIINSKLLREYKAMYRGIKFNNIDYDFSLSENFANDFSIMFLNKSKNIKTINEEEVKFFDFVKYKKLKYNKDFENFIKNYI